MARIYTSPVGVMSQAAGSQRRNHAIVSASVSMSAVMRGFKDLTWFGAMGLNLRSNTFCVADSCFSNPSSPYSGAYAVLAYCYPESNLPRGLFWPKTPVSQFPEHTGTAIGALELSMDRLDQHQHLCIS